MKLEVYADFNCPYSALASYRVDRLLASGAASVEWHAVQHDASMPTEGVPMQGEARAELEREIEEVSSLLRADESFRIDVPAVRPNTAIASRVFAARPSADLRRQLFAWAWDSASLPEDGPQDAETAAAWQRAWDAFDKKMVPMLVLPDGYRSRGLGALKRLADMVDDANAARADTNTST